MRALLSIAKYVDKKHWVGATLLSRQPLKSGPTRVSGLPTMIFFVN
jgi:hypothetical protein